MLLPFTKCHANGNDFIIIRLEDFPKEMHTKSIISKLCSRHRGIWADGLFIIVPSDKYDFMLDYYNADGSWETLCANGSRCAVQLMHQGGYIENKTVFLAGDGSHAAEIYKNGIVSMQMNVPEYRSDLLSPGGCDGYFVDSGARHFVYETESFEDDFVYQTGYKIRHHYLFSPYGINVNFYKIADSHMVDIKTYEKGIENIVLSCASGSTAVIFHLSKTERVDSPVLVRSTGGNLTFYFNAGWDDVWVEGPAEILFTGNIELDQIT